MKFKDKFFDITSLIQVEFDRNLELYGDKIKCGRGCAECCSQIFRITPLDGFIIKEHVKSLPLERQEELRNKAKDYMSKKEQGETKQPCPALGEEGECTIYEGRPVICRRFGMPIYDYKNPANIHACHLNFKNGEEITDSALVPNQTDIGKKWDELKDKFNERSKDGKEFTTIAESLAGR